MKVALYGKNSESLEKILLGKGVTVVDRHREDFDLLISYGGDGAMLGAELAYPQRLKMLSATWKPPLTALSIPSETRLTPCLPESLKSRK